MASDIKAVTYEGGATPTQSDTTADPAGPFAAFYVGGAGNVKVTDNLGNAITFVAPIVGQIINVAHSRVWATGTTATNIVCLNAYPEFLKRRGNP
jgi:hypothetical protein